MLIVEPTGDHGHEQPDALVRYEDDHDEDGREAESLLHEYRDEGHGGEHREVESRVGDQGKCEVLLLEVAEINDGVSDLVLYESKDDNEAQK